MKKALIIPAAALALSGCAESVESVYWPWNWSTHGAETRTAQANPAETRSVKEIAARIASSGPQAQAPAPYKRTYLEQGRAALNEGSPALAARAFSLSLAHEGDSALALTGLGVAYDRLGRSAAARVFLERAVDMEPDSAVARNNLGVHHWRHGNIEMALAHLERGAELAGENELLTRNLEMVASIQTEPEFDGGFGEVSTTSAPAPVIETAFANTAEGVKARLTDPGPSVDVDADRLEGFALAHVETAPVPITPAQEYRVTAPVKPRYHLYDPMVTPDAL